MGLCTHIRSSKGPLLGSPDLATRTARQVPRWTTQPPAAGRQAAANSGIPGKNPPCRPVSAEYFPPVHQLRRQLPGLRGRGGPLPSGTAGLRTPPRMARPSFPAAALNSCVHVRQRLSAGISLQRISKRIYPAGRPVATMASFNTGQLCPHEGPRPKPSRANDCRGIKENGPNDETNIALA